MVSKWIVSYNLLTNGVYWGYNPLTNHLLTSWDIQVRGFRGDSLTFHLLFSVSPTGLQGDGTTIWGDQPARTGR